MKILLYQHDSNPFTVHAMIPRKDKRRFYKNPIPSNFKKRQLLWDLITHYCVEYDPFVKEIDYVLTIEVDSKRIPSDITIHKIGSLYSMVFGVEFLVVSSEFFWENHPEHDMGTKYELL